MNDIYSSEQIVAINKLTSTLLEEMCLPTCIVDRQLQVFQVNPAFSIVLGTTVKALEGKGLSTYMATDSQHRLRAALRTMHIDGELTHILLDFNAGSKEKLSRTAKIRLVADPNDSCEFLILQLLEQSRISCSEFDAIDPGVFIHRLLHSSSCSVLLINGYTRTIHDCNTAAEELFGWSREEIIGRSPQFLAANSNLSREYVEKARSAYSKTGFFQGQLLCAHKNGNEFTTLASNICFFDHRGGISWVLAINRQLTEEIQKIEDLSRITKEALLHMEHWGAAVNQIMSHKTAIAQSRTFNTLGGLGFNTKQIEIIKCLLGGATNKSIAIELGMSESAIKSQLFQIYRRLGVQSRVECIRTLHEKRVQLE